MRTAAGGAGGEGPYPALEPWPDQELARQLERLPPQVRLTGDQRGRITGDLGEVEEALLLVGPLADRPRGRYTVNWSRDFIGTRCRTWTPSTGFANSSGTT